MSILLAYLPVSFRTNPRNNFRTVPTGVASLAAVARDYGVGVLDAVALKLDEMETRRAIEKHNPQILGFSVTTPQLETSLHLARYWKSKRPDATIVFGGAHISALPGETMRENDFVDYEIFGEGEETFLEFLHRLSNRESMEEVCGLVYRSRERVIVNARRGFISDLDSLPMPAYDLLPMDKYAVPQQRRSPFCSVITSRGCPYDCIYCSVGCVHGRQFRARSPEKVVEEFELLANRFGIREVMIKDSIFTVDQNRVVEICRLLREKRVRMTWSCNSRVNLAKPEMLKSLKEAGCWLVQYGVESADEDILGKARRNMTSASIRKAFQMTRDAGLETHAFFIIGLPGETRATCENTIDFARDLNPTYAGFSIAVPYPATALFDWVKDNAVLLEKDWKRFKMDKAVFETKAFSVEDMVAFQKKAYTRFYLNPKNISRRIRNLNWSDIRNVLFFAKVFLPARRKTELY